MRSLSEQTDAELGGTWSVLVRQKRVHVRLARLLDDMVATSGREQEAALRCVARTGPPDQSRVSHLMTCPWCLSVYVGAALTVARVRWPGKERSSR